MRDDGGHAVRKRQEQVGRYGADADGREIVRVGVSDVEAVVVAQYQVDARVRYVQVVEQVQGTAEALVAAGGQVARDVEVVVLSAYGVDASDDEPVMGFRVDHLVKSVFRQFASQLVDAVRRLDDVAVGMHPRFPETARRGDERVRQMQVGCEVAHMSGSPFRYMVLRFRLSPTGVGYMGQRLLFMPRSDLIWLSVRECQRVCFGVLNRLSGRLGTVGLRSLSRFVMASLVCDSLDGPRQRRGALLPFA